MSRRVEIWTTLAGPDMGPDPELTKLLARASRVEADGWSGATLADSQNLRGDVFVALTAVSLATSKLKIGTGTSNPATRHPAVIASAAASLQILSKGRMSLSLGRGDSSLAYIGVPPVPVGLFERGLAMIQTYLRGEGIPLEEAASMISGVHSGFDQLAIASAPEASRLVWLPAGFVKPEVEVTATGPKVIAAAARHADCISFAVGADVERLKWAIGIAREEIEKAGRAAADVRLGAYLPLYPHDNVDVARQLAQGMVASQSRFSIMNKKVVGPVTEAQRQVLEKVGSSYDMKNHGSASAKQSTAVDADFIDNFGLVGDPARCADRLQEIIELGVERLNLWTPVSTEGEPGESYRMAAERVLPAVKAAL